MRIGSRIYVAGHSGLLGSAIVRKLRSEGFTNLILTPHSELDLRDRDRTYEFLSAQKPDFVFLCAAKVGGIGANFRESGSFLLENLEIQNNVIEGSRRAGVGKLLFVGSSCIYPKDAPSPISESALFSGPLEPTNEGYALAKLTGVKMCQFYRQEYGCDYISALPTNLFGINDHYDLERSHLMPALIRKIHQAKLRGSTEIEIWGSGKPRREFMLSDDCADAILFLMKNYSDVSPLNVGTGEDKSVIELAETVGRVVGVEVKCKPNLSRPDGMMQKLLDVSKLRSVGWSSKVPLESGIRIAYENFLSQGQC